MIRIAAGVILLVFGIAGCRGKSNRTEVADAAAPAQGERLLTPEQARAALLEMVESLGETHPLRGIEWELHLEPETQYGGAVVFGRWWCDLDDAGFCAVLLTRHGEFSASYGGDFQRDQSGRWEAVITTTMTQ